MWTDLFRPVTLVIKTLVCLVIIKITPVPWGDFIFLVHTSELVCDIQLPFGGHHIHCNLFAPRGGKIDSDWHVGCYAPIYM